MCCFRDSTLDKYWGGFWLANRYNQIVGEWISYFDLMEPSWLPGSLGGLKVKLDLGTCMSTPRGLTS